MTERDILLKKIGTLKFAITDIDLFLNTHPGDTEMLKKRGEYERAAAPMIAQFEQRFGPLTKAENTTNSWAWISDPWPWDTEA